MHRWQMVLARKRRSASDQCGGIWQSSRAWGMPRYEKLQKNLMIRLRLLCGDDVKSKFMDFFLRQRQQAERLQRIESDVTEIKAKIRP
jgi:hypothetical protein